MSCDACYSGQYADEKGLTDCKYCLEGKFQPVTGATNSSDCKNCQLLTYNAFQGQRVCQECLTAKTLGAYGCAGCQGGSYTDTVGICKTCTPGRYSVGLMEIKGRECEQCPIGWYGKDLSLPEHKNRQVLDSCDGCPGGRYGNREGGSNVTEGCVFCIAGRYSNEQGAIAISGQRMCTGCLAGKYSDKEGRTDEAMCKNC